MENASLLENAVNSLIGKALYFYIHLSLSIKLDSKKKQNV